MTNSSSNNTLSQRAKDIAQELKTMKPQCIIGVGASAGGLAAIKSFCANIPVDINASIIVIQHLSPDFHTYMDELLEKHTQLSVKLAKDLQILEANTIYVLPSRKNLTIAGNKIMLSEPDERPVHHPIDYFFRSLAEERQNEAVGVVLSGTGNDGTRGLIDLKNVGALTLAQDPDTAEFTGMPDNAIKSGDVDFILPPEQMGSKIGDYIANHQELRQGQSVKDVKRTKELKEIFQKVAEGSKIDLRAYKLTTVERRIHHRMGILGIKTLGEYASYFQRSESELALLLDDISIGVTQFFRNPAVWKDLSKQYIDKFILETRPDDPIRIWVPGCSTGEEAYTLAILFEESMERLDEFREVRIFASDIDRSAIRYAGTGLYPEHIEQDIPTDLLDKYFIADPSGFSIVERIRKRVVFASHNLLEDPPFSNMDFVSCRNLLIYFQVHAQKDILSFLHFSLKPDGYLLLGEAESTSSLPNYFREVDHDIRLNQREKNTRVKLSNIGINERLTKHRKSFEHTGFYRTDSSQFDGRVPKLKEHLISLHVPATIVLDSKLNLVYSIGNTDLYTRKIKAGSHSMHFSKLLNEALVSVIGSLIRQVDERKKRILLTDVKLIEPDSTVTIDASFLPLSEGTISGHYLVSFFAQDTNTEEPSGNTRTESIGSSHQNDLRIQQLDSELMSARAMLGEKQQDLDALTEELQSTNEELMAANEELQSTNEELQSVNEELFTVNSEHQEKIEELMEGNQDLDNLLNATEVGVIYLDKHLLIRRFTPKTRKYINLLSLDINRPFTDISLNFEIEKLESKLRDVLRSKDRAFLKITELNGQAANILLTLVPYLGQREKIEGLILVFQDLNDIATSEEKALNKPSN